MIAPETARRLGCDAELVAQIERDGLPFSAGRRRRTVPPALRRLLEARDERPAVSPAASAAVTCRRTTATTGRTEARPSLDNLVLLCFHHHRLVHEGGFTIEDDLAGGLRFRNRYGLLRPTLPPRPPPGCADELLAGNHRQGLVIGPHTNRNGSGDPLDLGLAVSAIASADDPHYGRRGRASSASSSCCLDRPVERPNVVEDQRHARGPGRSSADLRVVSRAPDEPTPRLRGGGRQRASFSSIASRTIVALETPRSAASRHNRARGSAGIGDAGAIHDEMMSARPPRSSAVAQEARLTPKPETHDLIVQINRSDG